MSSSSKSLITSKAIRKTFIDFFVEKKHTAVASSSLIPGNDATLLFTNAGMVQFKDVFLGTDQRDYVRAVSSQRCVRAGGKHNDLENVGYTARHHTFFEMLGNFSFGDYFKRDAILYAWELLTQRFHIPAEKLTVTVYHNDDEAFNIWHDEIGVPKDRIIRIGNKADGSSDNFWQMGDTGPCGPCSEIFYDHGPSVAGGPPGSAEEDGDRYIEIWNLVFMQFNRDEKGTLHPLPKPSVDTGMGLERLAAVLQGVHSNYDIDLFQNLLQAAAKAVNVPFSSENSSLKVIADHIRSVAFLMVDGITPSNEGRGYVLRRIMRRAIRHGYKLGQKHPFLYLLVDALVNEMGEAYPELIQKSKQIIEQIQQEEQRFAETLEHGLKLLETDIQQLTDSCIDGKTVFKLYDTYGFPVDLTNDIAREKGLSLDMAAFEVCMQAQRERSRDASNFAGNRQLAITTAPTQFIGYDALDCTAKIIAIFVEGEAVNLLRADQAATLLLDITPFYAESGGQVGDTGFIQSPHGRFEVLDTKKKGAHYLHIGRLTTGQLALNETIKAHVTVGRRLMILANHSATHLLHAALRHVLGTHVEQRGSLVDENRLRFDFSHPQAMTKIEIRAVEEHINAAIRRNIAVTANVTTMDEAKQKGAMALFGEKYGDEVRVIQMDDVSIELCGGTHADRTGDIGLCKIISEGGVASGIRRIEAVTGAQAMAFIHQQADLLSDICQTIKSDPTRVINKIQQWIKDSKETEKALLAAEQQLALLESAQLLHQQFMVHDVPVIIHQVKAMEVKSLRLLVEQLRDKTKGAVLLAAEDNQKLMLVAGIHPSLNHKLNAVTWVNAAAERIGGKGGGRPDMATAGGNLIANANDALITAKQFIANTLQ